MYSCWLFCHFGRDCNNNSTKIWSESTWKSNYSDVLSWLEEHMGCSIQAVYWRVWAMYRKHSAIWERYTHQLHYLYDTPKFQLHELRILSWIDALLFTIPTSFGFPVEEFDYEGLCKALEQLSDFEKRANSRVIESGVLKGLNLDDIKRAGERLILQDGCASFFQNIVKNESLIADVHILSYCWCGDLIRSAFSSGMFLPW